MAIRIQLKNVGPIGNGAFELSRMAIFVGPNNAGKSVAAICAYAASLPAEWGTLFDTGLRQEPHRRKGSILDLPHLTQPEEEWRPISEAILEAVDQLQEGRPFKQVRIPGLLLQYAEEQIFKTLHVYGARVADELERCFGSKLEDLARRQVRANSEVVIRSSWPWTVRINLRGKSKVSVQRRPAPRRLLATALTRLAERKESDPIWFEPDRHRFLVSDVAWDVAHDLLRREFPSNAQYLPAERAGLLQGHRVIVGAVLRRAPYAGIERIPDMPQMSGVITDFLAKIILTPSEESTGFEATASDLERNVMGAR